MTEKLKVLKDSPPNPWYKNGIKFKCTQCGKCCTGGPGYVWVSKEDCMQISKHLGIDIVVFYRNYLKKIGSKYSLKEHKNFDYIFLKDKKCSIYEVRPIQCKTFPWWPHFLESSDNFNDVKNHWEGINHIDGDLVSFEKIQNSVNKHNIH